MTVPNILANGPGNWPDAAKFMDNLDYLDAIARGTFISNPGFELWTAGTSFVNPADNTGIADSWKWRKSGTTAPIATVSRETTNKDTGAYAIKIDVTTAGSSDSIGEVQQQNSNYVVFAGLTMLLGARVKASIASKVRLKITDGVTTAYSAYHSGGGGWESLYVTMAISASPTQLYSSIELEPADFTGQVYADSVFMFIIRASASATVKSALAMVPPDPGDVSALLTDVNALKSRTITGAGLATGGGDLTANRTITVPAAVQSDQETGSSTAVAVTPGVQQHHKSAAKFWVNFNGTGTVSVRDSYNVTSITDNGTGDYTVNLTTAFSSANHCCIALAQRDAGGADGSGNSIVTLSRVSSLAAGSVRVKVIDYDINTADALVVTVAGFGDQ